MSRIIARTIAVEEKDLVGTSSATRGLGGAATHIESVEELVDPRLIAGQELWL